MPYKAEDADRFKKGMTDEQKQAWADIANSAMKTCQAKGGKDCEAYAIKTANAMAMRVGESVDISFSTELIEAKAVDEEKGVYDVVLIKEGVTTDHKRDYTKKALESALPLFEGLQAYADHPTKTEMRDRPERSIRDLVGVYKNPVITESGSLKAELHTLDNASWVRPILKAACSTPGLCGLSIHGDGIVKQGKRGEPDIVESIDAMFSTDVVTKPNAGGEITRLIASDRGGEPGMEWEKITLEELKENRAELIDEFEKEARADERTKAEAEFKEAADKKDEGDMVKKSDYDELAKTVESMKVTAKIAESKLLEAISDKADKDVAEKELTEALSGKSDEDMDKVIEARKVFLKAVGVEVKGAPAKEAQGAKEEYKVGSILVEARQYT